MKRIIYLSEALIPFDQCSLQELADKSTIKNARLDITGYLYMQDYRFIQYLEGDEDNINGLMQEIIDDNRHDVVHIENLEERFTRYFPAWKMRFVANSELAYFNSEVLIEQHLLYLKRGFPNKERCRLNLEKHIDLVRKVYENYA